MRFIIIAVIILVGGLLCYCFFSCDSQEVNQKTDQEVKQEIQEGKIIIEDSFLSDKPQEKK